MTLAPPGWRTTEYIHRIDTRANQPLAADVTIGTLYFVTDESIIERSNGTIWELYSGVEQGDCTLTIEGSGGGSGQTYGIQEGHYIKIGNTVFVNGIIQLTSKGTISGDTEIHGFPFDIITTFPSNPCNWSLLNTAYVNMFVVGLTSTDTAQLQGITAAAVSANTPVPTADISNSTILVFSLFYRTN